MQPPEASGLDGACGAERGCQWYRLSDDPSIMPTVGGFPMPAPFPAGFPGAGRPACAASEAWTNSRPLSSDCPDRTRLAIRAAAVGRVRSLGRSTCSGETACSTARTPAPVAAACCRYGPAGSAAPARPAASSGGSRPPAPGPGAARGPRRGRHRVRPPRRRHVPDRRPTSPAFRSTASPPAFRGLDVVRFEAAGQSDHPPSGARLRATTSWGPRFFGDTASAACGSAGAAASRCTAPMPDAGHRAGRSRDVTASKERQDCRNQAMTAARRACESVLVHGG